MKIHHIGAKGASTSKFKLGIAGNRKYTLPERQPTAKTTAADKTGRKKASCSSLPRLPFRPRNLSTICCAAAEGRRYHRRLPPNHSKPPPGRSGTRVTALSDVTAIPRFAIAEKPSNSVGLAGYNSC